MKHESLIVWANGKFIPEEEATVSIFDDGFTRGDAVFDAARTFNGKPFQVAEHLERFFASCEVLNLKPSLSHEGLLRVAQDLVERNRPLLGRYEDFWIDFRVTRGSRRMSYSTDPATLVICDPIPFAGRAKVYRDGITLVTPSIRRTPPWAVSPRIKSHNYLNFVLADQEVKQNNPEAWPLLLDERGNLAEGSNSNIFLVRGKELLTPREQFVLPGISRNTVMGFGEKLGLTVKEMDLDLRDLYLADEAFLTSTSLCVCGVTSVNGKKLRQGAFGPVTTKLLTAYNSLVGMDIRQQYLAHLK